MPMRDRAAWFWVSSGSKPVQLSRLCASSRIPVCSQSGRKSGFFLNLVLDGGKKPQRDRAKRALSSIPNCHVWKV